jgi:CTP:molybdopterin cytidylyltransferase MocA
VNSAILVAAGQGTRMGLGVDKLFPEVAGRPLVTQTALPAVCGRCSARVDMTRAPAHSGLGMTILRLRNLHGAARV